MPAPGIAPKQAVASCASGLIRSRRHVVCVVAAVAAQDEVETWCTACRCVVGHVRGARHLNSDTSTGIPDSGIADYCATRAYYIVGESGAGDVVAADDPTGRNSYPLAGESGNSNYNIAPHDPLALIPSAERMRPLTRNPSTIEPSPASSTPPTKPEIDPFRTVMPRVLSPAAIAVVTVGKVLVPPIVKPTRSMVTKSAVITRQSPLVVRLLISLYEPGLLIVWHFQSPSGLLLAGLVLAQHPDARELSAQGRAQL